MTWSFHISLFSGGFMSNRFCILAAAVGLGVAGSAMASLTALDGQMDSSLFPHKYEGNVLPTAAGLGFVLGDPNNIAATGSNPASLGSSSGVDYLRIDTDTNATITANQFGDVWNYKVTGGTWNPDDSALGDFTVEIRAIVRASNSGTFGFGVAMVDQNSNGLMQFFNDKIIGPNDSVATAVSTASNSDTWHTFRIASYSPGGSSANQIFQVWRDGVEIGQLANNVNFLGEFLAFGDYVSGGAEVNVDIDYLRWDDTGSWAPVPVPEPAFGGLLAAGSALMFRRRSCR
jgi:hypothetical protein